MQQSIKILLNIYMKLNILLYIAILNFFLLKYIAFPAPQATFYVQF